MKKSGGVRRGAAEWACPSTRSEDAAASERVPQARPDLRLPVASVLPVPQAQPVPRPQGLAQPEPRPQERAQPEQRVLRDADQNCPMTK